MDTIGGFVWWALVGWCGTPWPRRWPIPWPPPPGPDPWITKVIGLVGGVVFGWGATAIGNMEVVSPEGMVASAVAAWVGSVFLNDIANLVMPGRKA